MFRIYYTGAIASHINDCCTLQPVDSGVEALSVGIERLIIAAEYFRTVRIAVVSADALNSMLTLPHLAVDFCRYGHA